MIPLRPRTKSLIFVFVQFAVIGAIALSGPLLARHPLLLVIELAGIGLGLWAILTMRPWNFNVTPDVKVEGVMVTRGPYALIRHPMYASIFLVTGALVADAPSSLRIALLLILVVDIVLKLSYEERLLAAHYPAYAQYMQRSKRLIPFVY